MDKDRFERRCQRMLTSESEAEVDETPLRRTSISSTLIDEFVKADLNAGMANCDTRLKDGPRREDDLLHNRIQKFLSTKVLESGTFAIFDCEIFELVKCVFIYICVKDFWYRFIKPFTKEKSL